MPTDTTTRHFGDELPIDPDTPASVSNGKLWFQVLTSAIAWFGLGLGDMLITWQACLHQEQFGGPSVHPGARVLYFSIATLVLGLACFAGAMSYRSWQKLSGITALLSAEGRERKEFMSLAGLYISFTLGVGIVWLCLPLFLIQMCMRAR